MEELILRFGHLSEQIFDSLDNEYLSNCRKVCRNWCQFLNESKCFNTRIIPAIQQREGKLHQLGVDLRIDISHFKRLKMKVILTALDQVNQLCSWWKTVDPWGQTPFHIMAGNGHLELYKLTIENAEEKHPRDKAERTPLHLAASNGHLEICQLIIDNVQDTNPSDLFGRTPLHLAALEGYFKVCQLIIDNVQDKNPSDLYGKTPLHFAARNGHLEVFQLIIDNVEGKNPTDFFGNTPCSDAVENGHEHILEIFQYSE